ncbi:MAG: hypothetical protein OXP69_08675 [Spirochaetaceae bacterium]|nr:hypothetical protein [Spirochaetaceae bacterium]
MRSATRLEADAPKTRVARIAASKHFVPVVLFAACLGVYVANGDFLPGNDQVGNMLFSVNLLKRHTLAISPPVAPEAFFWTIEKPGTEPVSTDVDEWTESVDADYREGRLAARSHFYYVSPTMFPDVYVNTFGIGAPLAGLPVYAVLDLFVDIANDRFWWWHGAALTASLLTATAAVFVFLAARGFVPPVPAVLITLAFGLGSCAWPVSSQALWQHPASTFFLSLAAWLLLRSESRPLAAAWCGAAFGMAVLCRPTTAVAVVCAGAYLLWVDRRRCAAFVLGGLPFLAFLTGYNYHYFGHPFAFGQSVVASGIALSKTGSADLWQSSWSESLPGLLISPARGLIWFSPVLVLGFAGTAAVWRNPRYRPFIPLQLGAAAMILVAGKWFDWWGGLTWGYRSIIDASPFLALLLVPIEERIVASRPLRVVCGLPLAWSIAAQFIGAYSYSLMGWSDLWRHYDKPEQASLWRWDRPQIGYHLVNFRSERARKKKVMTIYLNYQGPIVNLPGSDQDSSR